MKDFFDRVIEADNEKDLRKKYEANIFRCRKALKSKSNFGICVVISIIGGLVTGFLLYVRNYKLYRPYSTENYKFLVYYLPIIVGIVFAITVTFCSYILSSYNLESRLTDYEWELMRLEAEELKEDAQEDIFNNSIKMSYKYLDQYYHQTKDQAQKGFSITVYVAVIGALLIIVGIISMFMGKTNPAYVSAGSGILIEFISSIFFYLYNKTVTSMSKYHDKLVLSQNISIALKVAESLPSEDKTASKNLIIKELLKDVNHYLVSTDNEKAN